MNIHHMNTINISGVYRQCMSVCLPVDLYPAGEAPAGLLSYDVKKKVVDAYGETRSLQTPEPYNVCT